MSITFTSTDPIPVNTYSLVLNITSDYYAGEHEEDIVIYDPSLRFTTGGGWFYWPADKNNPELEGAKTNFGHTMKCDRESTSVQGSFLLLAHLTDGGIIRMKSNSVYGLAIMNNNYPGVASFSGKCVYTRLDSDGNILAEVGNQEFTVYVKDMDEPGTGTDMFWFTTKLTVDGDRVSLHSNNDGKADENEYAPLNDGNIVVPHTNGSSDPVDPGETEPVRPPKKK